MKYYVSTTKDNIKHLNNKQINNVNISEENLTFETNEKSLIKLLEDIKNLSYLFYRSKFNGDISLWDV
jgi:hypothetical protein